MRRRSPLSCHPWGTLNIPRGSQVPGARASLLVPRVGRPLQPDHGARCTMSVSLPFASNHIRTSLFSMPRKERIWNNCVALQLEGAFVHSCRHRACVSAFATRHQGSVARFFLWCCLSPCIQTLALQELRNLNSILAPCGRHVRRKFGCSTTIKAHNTS